MTGLLPSLAAVGGILLLAGTAGHAAAVCLLPGRSAWRRERLSWGLALGLFLLAGSAALSLAVGVRPGWIAFLLLSAFAVMAGRLFRLRAEEGEGAVLLPLPSGEGRDEGGLLVTFLLLPPLFLGVLLYALRALTEPMWAADFLAIWGWKGKTIFASASIPAWTWRLPELSFTHPEYPLGLPFLYAGIAFLLGRWDDHAMALLFPFLQGATLLLLAGWLRRRGASRGVALAGAAALSLFEPLYRAFTTGMAEVPLSFFLLLLATSLADALDGEKGSGRRLALAAAGSAGLKNEGLFAAAIAAAIAVVATRKPWRERWRVAGAALIPALAVSAAHRIGRGPLPLRDFRFDLVLEPEFLSRLLLGLRTILGETSLPGASGVLAFGMLLVAGRRSRSGDRLLALAGALLAAYAILPAFCVWGPDWLARTAFARTAAALAPLAAAAAALRLAPVLTCGGESTGSAADPAA
ncbi:MAG: hypothetical protein ACM3SU_07895 [Acidobacteriota bacterium]